MHFDRTPGTREERRNCGATEGRQRAKRGRRVRVVCKRERGPRKSRKGERHMEENDGEEEAKISTRNSEIIFTS